MIPRFKPNLGWDEFYAIFRNNKGAVERFEEAFAEAFNAKEAVSFPYGRSAQWAFFKAHGIEDAEIIMPAYTCSVVAHAVKLSGNQPVFVDIQLSDYNMDLCQLASKVTPKTRAIVATHTFGYPQDIEQLESIANDAGQKYGHKVWLMQDCCHAFGAQWKGRDIGSSGDVAVYAFNISKLLTCVFGGMLTFQDKQIAKKLRAFRDKEYQNPSFWKAIARRIYLLAIYPAFNELVYGFVWLLQEKTTLLNKFTESYHLDEKIHFPPDYRDLMMDFEAAIGLEQLDKYHEIIRERRINAVWYDENLTRKNSWVYPQLVEGATYSHYVVRVPNRRQILAEYASRGVHLGKLIEYSIPETAPYKKINQSYPNSYEASLSTVNFPMHKIIK